MAVASWDQMTAREKAVLAAVERRLNNGEIADELFISVRTVESHIASLRRKLEADSRSKLITAAQAQRSAAVQVPQNSFVGRADDLEAVRALLERGRWVTIVGPAGCGKTRLALEVAATDGRVPVVAELEHSKPGAVVSVLAKAIGLGIDSNADPVAACGLALASRPYLLVIDNCDRVTEAVGEVVGRLLSLAGSLTVLATSRSPIGGSDETVHQLLPLVVEGSEATGAVQLFLDRARTAAPTVEISADDGKLVAGICKRLDGLPLAIELAAARMRHLPLPELAARLEDGFGPLGSAGASSRHRTLKTAFEWTWDLLDRDEQSVLCHLAALPLTFDVDLAEAVSTPGADGVVFRLLDRSLVSPTVKVSDPRRFRLLDSLREFVLDRTEPTIVEEVLRTHALHHATLAGELTKRSRTDDSKEAAEMANRLCPEMNAAIRWAISGEHELALALARALSVGCEQYGADPDSLKAIARAARDPKVRGLATPADLLVIGIALCYDDLDLVAELAELALGIADDDQSELAARHLAGYADAYRQRGKSALVHFDIAERLADEALDMWQLASIRQGRGLALRGAELNDPEGAIAAFESAMHTFALAGDAMHVNNSRYMMAATAAQSGLDTKQATMWAEQCAAYARDSGNRHELAHAILTLSALSTGHDADADIADAIATFRAVGDLRCLARSYLLLAERRPVSERIPLLEQAFDTARTAHDVDNQTTSLERLIRAHWEAGAQRAAVIALGALTNLIGYEPATGRCPEVMLEELDKWDTAIAEGRARWPQSG